jgi:predicted mannosyl-3-phosphoglycerate phosphatase (HAD superfamily)
MAAVPGSLRPLSDLADQRGGTDVQVIYSDLDGTMLGRGGAFLLDAGGSATLEPAEVLLESHRRGVEIVPTTGRTLRGLLGDARMLGLRTVIAEMGAVIAYELGRDIVTNLGEYPGGEEPPAEHMERVGAVRALFEAFPGRLEHHTPWAAWREYTQLLRGLVDPAEAEAVLGEAGFGWLTIHDNGRLHGSYLDLAPGRGRVYHLLPRGVGKGSAVALDRERRGVERDRTIAIGDSLADLAMAPEVGILVLVRDAVEDDPALAAAASEIENACCAERAGNLGWCDAVRSLALGASSRR